MPSTLVTGANGFVAATIIDDLIAQGHTVTGSVRSTAKGEQMLAFHPEYKGKLDFVVVSDYAAPGTWDKTFQEKEFEYVIHTAAPLLDDPANTDFVKHFLEPNIASRTFTSSEWLPLTINDAISAQHPYISYCVAKSESEKALWKYYTDSTPPYKLTVLLPGLIFGPPLQPVTNLKKINYSNDVFYSLFNGTYETTPDTSFPSYIDVRDLSFAHIQALTMESVWGQRLIVGGNKYSSQIAVDALKKVEGLEGRLPKDGEEAEKVVNFGDVEAWNGKIGLVPRSPETTFGDAARRILELETLLK
ncbi:hypothetical protein BJ875DRAFT_376469 [Amylocarpus encephaloides]|uniref:NAD-dependent epimerase/dehydratase domain-containing protein n=1 Tax=Amylocarpus encephaloides TaxID=45428 RepID=A0A9P8C5B0_9HELO|nr:hypothetical protein BJ875DRAFT_376469 [Amylocarpus encephaloides]